MPSRASPPVDWQHRLSRPEQWLEDRLRTVQLTQDAYSYATFPMPSSAPAVVFPTIDAVNNSSDQNTLLTARTMNGFTVFQAADISNVSLPYIAIGR
jgi:hypothetical protein